MGNRTSGRKEMYNLLRERNHLVPYTDEYGNQTMLNTTKHFVQQKPYKHDGYNRELSGIAQKFTEYMKSKREENMKKSEVIQTSDEGVTAEVVN